MAGYDGYSKSNNALAAESDGKLTATAMAAYLSTFSSYKGIKPAHVRDAMNISEWHHTSCKFNKTNYYDKRDLGCASIRKRLQFVIAGEKMYNKLLVQLPVDERGVRWVWAKINGRLEKWHPANPWSELTFRGDTIKQAMNRREQALCRVNQQLSQGYAE